MSAIVDRTPTRVRHVERITPHLVRITLGGDDLAGFASPGFDDHVKLLFPDPQSGEIAEPGGSAAPIARDYTPRRHDPAAHTLEIDFALHEAGPATRWALAAEPGQRIVVGGPKGSFILPTAFDWHLLIGDDTALPAIGRRLAELPAGARAIVLAEIDGPADRIAYETAANADLLWVLRDDGEDLLGALRALKLPAGDFHAWIACETQLARALRAELVERRGANPKWVKAAGYWRRGRPATHDHIDE